jgi:hypothetical protein
VAKKALREAEGLREELQLWRDLESRAHSTFELLELAQEENDQSVLADVESEAQQLAADFDHERLVLVGLRQLEEFQGGLGPRLQAAPEGQLLAQALSFAQHFLGPALVVPESGRAYAGVEFKKAGFFGEKVKDAPRSPGSL